MGGGGVFFRCFLVLFISDIFEIVSSRGIQMRRKIFLKAASYICAISLSVSAFSNTAVYAEETTVGNEVIESVTQTADDTETTKGTETVTETETVSETETVNEEPQKDPDKPVKKKKISLIGNTVNRAVYVKRNAKSYDRYLNRIGTLKKGVRYFEVKRLKNGYSQLKVDGKALYVKTSYLTYKCNAKKFVSTSDKLYSYEDMVEDIEKLQNALEHYTENIHNYWKNYYEFQKSKDELLCNIMFF